MKLFILTTSHEKLRDKYFSTLKAALAFFNQMLSVYMLQSSDAYLKEYKLDGKGEYQVITYPLEYDATKDIVTVRDENTERLLKKYHIQFISKIVKPSITTNITNYSNNSSSSIQEGAEK